MLAKYYKILDIPANADLDTIKKAFREKAKEFHPDLNASEDAHEKFIDIHNAYQTIIDHKEGLDANQQSIFEEQREAYINDMYRKWLINEMRKSQARVRMQRMKEQTRELTQREKRLQSIGDVFTISIGTFIFIGTIIGLNQAESENKVFGSFFTFGISLFLVFYPLYIKRKHRL